PATHKGKFRLWKRRDANKWNTLHEGAVLACGLQPFQRELCRDVLGGDIAAALASAAAFQQIVGKKADVGAYAPGVDFLHGRDRGWGKVGRSEIGGGRMLSNKAKDRQQEPNHLGVAHAICDL